MSNITKNTSTKNIKEEEDDLKSIESDLNTLKISSTKDINFDMAKEAFENLSYELWCNEYDYVRENLEECTFITEDILESEYRNNIDDIPLHLLKHAYKNFRILQTFFYDQKELIKT